MSHATQTHRWIIMLTVMSAAVMQVIDMTIINVALPHMQGSLQANPDQITWTLTSYLVSSAIFMPLTGYFTDKLGRKTMMLVSIAGFVLASALCGAAESLNQLIFFRFIQGALGAAIVPLSQSIMTEIFPLDKRPMAMAIWGIGIMLGPSLGPTVGGYLTQIANWRWVFYVNIPIGFFALLLALETIPDTPKKPRQMDWIALILISCFIGFTQLILDQGNNKDWFNSQLICIALFIALFSFFSFIVYNLGELDAPLFNLRIFKDRNFVIACAFISCLGTVMFGSMVTQPLFLESLLNYPVLTTGLVMAPRGLSSMLGMLLSGKLLKHYDGRYVMFSGIILCMYGLWVPTHYSFNINLWWTIWPFIIQGLGLGLIFTPLTTLAFSTLSAELRIEAASVFSLLRTFGAALGIAITMSFFTRHSQMAWNHLGSYLQPEHNLALQNYLRPLSIDVMSREGAAIIVQEISRQADMLSYVNTFSFMSSYLLLLIPLVWAFKKTTIRQLPLNKAEQHEI